MPSQEKTRHQRVMQGLGKRTQGQCHLCHAQEPGGPRPSFPSLKAEFTINGVKLCRRHVARVLEIALAAGFVCTDGPTKRGKHATLTIGPATRPVRPARRIAITAALLVLTLGAACRRESPVAPPALPGGVCVIVDTLWRSADTVLVSKAYYSGDRCPAKRP